MGMLCVQYVWDDDDFDDDDDDVDDARPICHMECGVYYSFMRCQAASNCCLTDYFD